MPLHKSPCSLLEYDNLVRFQICCSTTLLAHFGTWIFTYICSHRTLLHAFLCTPRPALARTTFVCLFVCLFLMFDTAPSLDLEGNAYFYKHLCYIHRFPVFEILIHSQCSPRDFSRSMPCWSLGQPHSTYLGVEQRPRCYCKAPPRNRRGQRDQEHCTLRK